MKLKISLDRAKFYSVLLALLMLIIDRVSKMLAHTYLSTMKDPLVIIPGVIDFRYLENTGAAFGMLADKRWVFLVATSVFLVVAIIAFLFIKNNSKLVNFALMLIISGGIGNMIDRIVNGFVVDFINFTFMRFYVFNIADSCVVIGCGLFILSLLIESFSNKKDKAKE